MHGVGVRFSLVRRFCAARIVRDCRRTLYLMSCLPVWTTRLLMRALRLHDVSPPTYFATYFLRPLFFFFHKPAVPANGGGKCLSAAVHQDVLLHFFFGRFFFGEACAVWRGSSWAFARCPTSYIWCATTTNRTHPSIIAFFLFIVNGVL